MAEATSSGVPLRPIGTWLPHTASSEICDCVAIHPGATALTVMPCGDYADLLEDDLDAVSDRMDKVRANAFVGFS